MSILTSTHQLPTSVILMIDMAPYYRLHVYQFTTFYFDYFYNLIKTFVSTVCTKTSQSHSKDPSKSINRLSNVAVNEEFQSVNSITHNLLSVNLCKACYFFFDLGLSFQV